MSDGGCGPLEIANAPSSGGGTLRGDVAKHIDDANLGFGQPGVHLFLQLANVRFKRLEDLI